MNPTELPWYAAPVIFGATVSQIWFTLGPILSAFLAVMATHRLTRLRDRDSFIMRLNEEATVAARRVRRERLLEAYRRLDASEPQRTAFKGLAYEEVVALLMGRVAAFSEVNLFGDELLCKQIDLMIEQGVDYDTSHLMNPLRDLLRLEYGLEMTTARYKWVDVKISQPATAPANFPSGTV